MEAKSQPQTHRRGIWTILVLVTVLALGASLLGPVTNSRSYIVQGESVESVVRLVERYGGQVTSRLDVIHGVGARLTEQAAALLLKEAQITSVFPNSIVQATGNGNTVLETDYPDLVGADVVWAEGVIGEGVTVAVLDTGLSNHPAIKFDTDGHQNDRIVAWVDFIQNKNNPLDPNGHGTHVAGIIANSQTGEDGDWNGVAPGVSLAGVRVLDKDGYGTYETVIQGLQWVITHHEEYNIRVVNLSLVSPVQSPYWADPLNQAVMQTWAEGIVVVVAAGNTGPNAMTVGVPGNTPYVITVGAFTDNYTVNDWNDDYLTPFSAAGPTLDGFVKPDVLAPGAHILSSMLYGTTLAQTYPENKVLPQYFSMAGTSQAAAVASGVAALTLSANPSLTPDQVKYRMMYSSYLWVDPLTTNALYSIWQQGAGRLNAPGAAFDEITGNANAGMDILADLAGTQHYEGYSYYDEEAGEFRLGGQYGAWSGGYGAWSGGYGAWSGGYGAWSGGYGAWSGGYGAWSGGYGAWSGGYGAWSGGYGAWSGGYGAWSGGYGAWSGGYGAWSGSEPWAGTIFAQPAFVETFLAGIIPNASTSLTSIGNWVDEP